MSPGALASTGDLEGLHSSGNGLGMDGTEDEKDSGLFLKESDKEERVRKTAERKIIMICRLKGRFLRFLKIS